MRAFLRVAVLLAASFSFSMSCAVPVVDSSESQRSGASNADERVASTEAELYGTTTHCLDTTVLRWQWPYADNFFGNMQTFSNDLPTAQKEWWNRTDCAALVVDWVRNPAIGREGVEGFMAGIIDPAVADQDTCPNLWQSQKIVTHSQGLTTQWITRLNKDEPGCNASHLWIGRDSSSPSAWFRFQSPVRVIIQGFYSVWPVPVSAYLETAKLGPCPPDFCCTQC